MNIQTLSFVIYLQALILLVLASIPFMIGYYGNKIVNAINNRKKKPRVAYLGKAS